VSDGGALIARLTPVTLVVGKGGVGKTTVAAALSRWFAAHGERTLVVSTDPAATLLPALGRKLERTVAPVGVSEGMDAWAFDTAGVRDQFLARWRAQIATILDRGTYLDRADVDGLVDAAMPGADEIFAVIALSDVIGRTGKDRYSRIVIDTAPTGHTLRLLTLPRAFDALVRLLDTMQEKHRFMVRALTHRYRTDAADAFIDELREKVGSLQTLLTDQAGCSAILVTRNEPVVIAESQRYLDALQLTGINTAAVIVNASNGSPALQTLAPVFAVPVLENPIADLVAFIHARDEKEDRGVPLRASAYPAFSAVKLEKPAKPNTLGLELLIVGGKGGVGKTTTACALALTAADVDKKVLLVSTDPAPSIGDALGLDIGDRETAIPGAVTLVARQIDATAAFRTFRDSYQARIDELFEGIAGKSVDIAHDRDILRDLFSLAPPGIDEVYALTVLGEELESHRFDQVVIDPAPTGHLLRLLDMPKMAVAWSHQLMRLMLKYQQVVGLGDAAQDLLDFAKRTRALDQRLHDPARAGTLLVALDEPLVREETSRLVGALEERQLPIAGILWNRAESLAPPLPVDPSIQQFFAPLLAPPPAGIDDLRAWGSRWGRLGNP
jgi:arsenite-transporting ATPase